MISGIYTGFTLLVFLGVVAWAWSKHNKKTFEHLSHMALQEDDQMQDPEQEKSDE